MSRAKLAFWVLGIFLIGAFTGGVATFEYQRRAMNMIMEGGPKGFGKFFMDKMAAELKLDGAQRKAFEGIMAEVHEGIREIRHQARPRIEEILNQARPKMIALLRPDQVEIFEKMEARRKEFKKGHGEHDAPPPPPGDQRGSAPLESPPGGIIPPGPPK